MAPAKGSYVLYNPAQIAEENPEWYAFISKQFLKEGCEWNTNLLSFPLGKPVVILMKTGPIYGVIPYKVDPWNQVLYRNIYTGQPWRGISTDIFAWQTLENMDGKYKYKISSL